uniref:Uncharacterized protein n=1 Tax=Peronospora matthiolae TaxID=2874970 RepID=A0AAV1UNB3_9STRA
MHVKRSTSTADRRRLMASDSASDSDALDSNQRLNCNVKGRKRKNEEEEVAKKVSRKTSSKKEKELNSVSKEGAKSQKNAVHAPDAAYTEELKLIAMETRQLNFEVAKWKQQQTLRRERLQLKREEIQYKEKLTKQQLQVQVMELRARLGKALDEAGQSPAQAKKYLALLKQKEERERGIE